MAAPRELADLAEACKLIAQMLSRQATTRTKPKRELVPPRAKRVPLHVNEVTGNGKPGAWPR